MSIIIQQIRLPYAAAREEAIAAAARSVGVKHYEDGFIYRESLDLRHNQLNRIYSVGLSLGTPEQERSIAERFAAVCIKQGAELPKASGKCKLRARPVVIGFGPCGMFAALALAEAGFKPVVLERGGSMDERDAAVERFCGSGVLDETTNIQFGEGGAGAYSDGKLTTRINDPLCTLVLELLRKHGAPEDALRLTKPHIGTDLLKDIVVSIRRRIVELGGDVFFNSPVTDIITANGKLSQVRTASAVFDAETALLAIGHSARDTLLMLHGKGIEITPKAFSVGLRIEHRRTDVNASVYGRFADMPGLPAAEYTLAEKISGRGCYSFCMCPGGKVIAAASEQGALCVNGMSYHARNGENSNAAVCVSVNPDDFGASDPLAGIAFQRKLEKLAFERGGGDFCAPVQLVSDFIAKRRSERIQGIVPSYPIGFGFTDFYEWLPPFVYDTISGALPLFAKKFSCFGREDAVFTGVESRTSSPVRILRNTELECENINGLMPCGEGAGYAGGIMSAAVDGIKAAAKILEKYCV